MRTTIPLMLLFTACATSPRVRTGSLDRASTQAVEAMTRGDYSEAVGHAEHGLAYHPKDAWLAYDRGSALVAMGQLDEGLPELRRAEQGFTNAHDRSLAVYRGALALEQAGRCDEAAQAFDRYATLIRPESPKLADDALMHVNACVAPIPGVREAKVDSTEAVYALTAGDFDKALKYAEAGLRLVPGDPWLQYTRGTALVDLGIDHGDPGRLALAADVLKDSEQRFPIGDVRGRSIVVFRRSEAFESFGHCKEATAEMKRFAAMVKDSRPDLAKEGLAHNKHCRTELGNMSLY
jgi:tetratricopeptide (TPR) repeat protein